MIHQGRIIRNRVVNSVSRGPNGTGRALIQAHRRQRDKQPNKEELYGMGDTTDVGAHPHANGGKWVWMGDGSR